MPNNSIELCRMPVDHVCWERCDPKADEHYHKPRYEVGTTCCEKYGKPVEHLGRLIHTDICGDFQPHIAPTSEVTTEPEGCALDLETLPPDSPKGKLWRRWFERVGKHATLDVVNATCHLVLGEREIDAQAVTTEPSVEDALAAALILCPHNDIEVTAYAASWAPEYATHGDDTQSEVEPRTYSKPIHRIQVDNKVFTGTSLTEALQAVREWRKSHDG